MRSRARELSVPAKLAGFVVVLAAVFGSAFLTGGRFGPTVAPAPAAAETAAPTGMAGHDEPAGTRTGDAPTDDHGDAGEHAGHQQGTPPYTLDGYAVVLDQTTVDAGRQRLTFRLLGPDGRPVTDYTVVQTKLLHLILVREDLGGFAHVHPEQRADGSWTVTTALAAGRWRAYADFQPTALGREITLSTPLTVRGGYQPRPVPPPAATSTVDGYTVTATAAPVQGQATPISISIARDGQPVTDLQPYLGAPAHLVIIRYHDLAYLHVHGHAESMSGSGGSAGPVVETEATFDSNGTYRMFVEFSHGGSVHRAEFTWVVT